MGIPTILQHGMNQMTPAITSMIRKLATKRASKPKKKRSSSLGYYKVKTKRAVNAPLSRNPQFRRKKAASGSLSEYKVKSKKMPTTYSPKIKFGSPAWQKKYKVGKFKAKK